MYEKYEAKIALPLCCEVVVLQKKFTLVSVVLVAVNIKKILLLSVT